MQARLTLEDDVVVKLRAESQRTGKPVKDVVNEALRRGLEHPTSSKRGHYRVQARNLGLRDGFDLDDIYGLIERLEGPAHR